MAWGQTPASYLLPSVKLTVAGTGWLTGAAVTSWSLDRELVASTIPGNIRQRNGLSIGAASVSVRPAVRATPWSTTPATRVGTGVPATLYVEDPAGGASLPLGSWVTDETDGTLSSAEVSIDLLEAQYLGRKRGQALESYNGPLLTPEAPIDPAWTMGRLLDQAGLPPVPPPVSTAIAAAPLHGGLGVLPTQVYPVSPYLPSGEVSGWQVLTGDTAVGPSSDSGLILIADGQVGPLPVRDLLATAPAGVCITLNVVGTVFLLDFAQGWMIRIVNDRTTNTYTIAVSNNLGAVTDVRTFPGTQSTDWPNRVQIQLARAISPTTPGMWTQFLARARSGPSAAWSNWSTHTANYTPSADWLEMLYVVAGVPDGLPGTGVPVPMPVGQFAAVQINPGSDASNAGLWLAPKARLKPMGADAGVPMVPAGMDAWTAVQDLSSAYCAATVVGLDGVATVLTRDELAGVGNPGVVTDIGAEWSDLPWTLDPDDSADRLEVTYYPPSLTKVPVGSSALAAEVWRATEVIAVPAGQTITIPATFESRAAINLFEGFLIPTTPSPLWSQRSTIIAFDNPGGTGSPLSGPQFKANAVQTSATTANIKVQNLTAATMYLVDGNGEPALILRAGTVASYETPAIVERGAEPEAAERALAVDLSTWVQSQTEAERIADYLWARLSGGGLWKAASVRCRLDWGHDLARILRGQHPATGLDSKVLISKVGYDGQEGEVAQTIDLVLLPPTWADWDALNAATPVLDTWAEWDSRYATKTWTDFDANPLWNGA
ncbi:hypothetical protein [Pimelobacter simplex]|uniref:hypothetical protein n=1 Tax=Nocardioides simplex TaxID=2045 RepID=UPI003AAEFADF